MYYTMKECTTYDNVIPGIFDNVNETSHWHNITKYRLGTQYQHSEKLTLRAGIDTDPTPFSLANMTFLNVNQFAMTNCSVGAGYDFGKIVVDGSYTHSFSDSPSKGNRTSQFPVNALRLDVKYCF